MERPQCRSCGPPPSAPDNGKNCPPDETAVAESALHSRHSARSSAQRRKLKLLRQKSRTPRNVFSSQPPQTFSLGGILGLVTKSSKHRTVTFRQPPREKILELSF